MTRVESEAVRAVGYDPDARVLRVEFRESGVYDYLDVPPALFEEMLRPHPWSRVGEEVKSHRFRRVA